MSSPRRPSSHAANADRAFLTAVLLAQPQSCPGCGAAHEVFICQKRATLECDKLTAASLPETEHTACTLLADFCCKNHRGDGNTDIVAALLAANDTRGCDVDALRILPEVAEVMEQCQDTYRAVVVGVEAAHTAEECLSMNAMQSVVHIVTTPDCAVQALADNAAGTFADLQRDRDENEAIPSAEKEAAPLDSAEAPADPAVPRTAAAHISFANPRASTCVFAPNTTDVTTSDLYLFILRCVGSKALPQSVPFKLHEVTACVDILSLSNKEGNAAGPATARSIADIVASAITGAQADGQQGVLPPAASTIPEVPVVVEGIDADEDTNLHFGNGFDRDGNAWLFVTDIVVILANGRRIDSNRLKQPIPLTRYGWNPGMPIVVLPVQRVAIAPRSLLYKDAQDDEDDESEEDGTPSAGSNALDIEGDHCPMGTAWIISTPWDAVRGYAMATSEGATDSAWQSRTATLESVLQSVVNTDDEHQFLLRSRVTTQSVFGHTCRVLLGSLTRSEDGDAAHLAATEEDFALNAEMMLEVAAALRDATARTDDDLEASADEASDLTSEEAAEEAALKAAMLAEAGSKVQPKKPMKPKVTEEDRKAAAALQAELLEEEAEADRKKSKKKAQKSATQSKKGKQTAPQSAGSKTAALKQRRGSAPVPTTPAPKPKGKTAAVPKSRAASAPAQASPNRSLSHVADTTDDDAEGAPRSCSHPPSKRLDKNNAVGDTRQASASSDAAAGAMEESAAERRDVQDVREARGLISLSTQPSSQEITGSSATFAEIDAEAPATVVEGHPDVVSTRATRHSRSHGHHSTSAHRQVTSVSKSTSLDAPHNTSRSGDSGSAAFFSHAARSDIVEPPSAVKPPRGLGSRTTTSTTTLSAATTLPSVSTEADASFSGICGGNGGSSGAGDGSSFLVPSIRQPSLPQRWADVSLGVSRSGASPVSTVAVLTHQHSVMDDHDALDVTTADPTLFPGHPNPHDEEANSRGMTPQRLRGPAVVSAVPSSDSSPVKGTPTSPLPPVPPVAVVDGDSPAIESAAAAARGGTTSIGDAAREHDQHNGRCDDSVRSSAVTDDRQADGVKLTQACHHQSPATSERSPSQRRRVESPARVVSTDRAVGLLSAFQERAMKVSRNHAAAHVSHQHPNLPMQQTASSHANSSSSSSAVVTTQSPSGAPAAQDQSIMARLMATATTGQIRRTSPNPEHPPPSELPAAKPEASFVPQGPAVSVPAGASFVGEHQSEQAPALGAASRSPPPVQSHQSSSNSSMSTTHDPYRNAPETSIPHEENPQAFDSTPSPMPSSFVAQQSSAGPSASQTPMMAPTHPPASGLHHAGVGHEGANTAPLVSGLAVNGDYAAAYQHHPQQQQPYPHNHHGGVVGLENAYPPQSGSQTFVHDGSGVGSGAVAETATVRVGYPQDGSYAAYPASATSMASTPVLSPPLAHASPALEVAVGVDAERTRSATAAAAHDMRRREHMALFRNTKGQQGILTPLQLRALASLSPGYNDPDELTRSATERTVVVKFISPSSSDAQIAALATRFGTLLKVRVQGREYTSSKNFLVAFFEFLHWEAAAALLSCTGEASGNFFLRAELARKPVSSKEIRDAVVEDGYVLHNCTFGEVTTDGGRSVGRFGSLSNSAHGSQAPSTPQLIEGELFGGMPYMNQSASSYGTGLDHPQSAGAPPPYANHTPGVGAAVPSTDAAGDVPSEYGVAVGAAAAAVPGASSSTSSQRCAGSRAVKGRSPYGPAEFAADGPIVCVGGGNALPPPLLQGSDAHSDFSSSVPPTPHLSSPMASSMHGTPQLTSPHHAPAVPPVTASGVRPQQFRAVECFESLPPGALGSMTFPEEHFHAQQDVAHHAQHARSQRGRREPEMERARVFDDDDEEDCGPFQHHTSHSSADSHLLRSNDVKATDRSSGGVKEKRHGGHRSSGVKKEVLRSHLPPPSPTVAAAAQSTSSSVLAAVVKQEEQIQQRRASLKGATPPSTPKLRTSPYHGGNGLTPSRSLPPMEKAAGFADKTPTDSGATDPTENSLEGSGNSDLASAEDSTDASPSDNEKCRAPRPPATASKSTVEPAAVLKRKTKSSSPVKKAHKKVPEAGVDGSSSDDEDEQEEVDASVPAVEHTPHFVDTTTDASHGGTAVLLPPSQSGVSSMSQTALSGDPATVFRRLTTQLVHAQRVPNPRGSRLRLRAQMQIARFAASMFVENPTDVWAGHVETATRSALRECRSCTEAVLQSTHSDPQVQLRALPPQVVQSYNIPALEALRLMIAMQAQTGEHGEPARLVLWAFEALAFANAVTIEREVAILLCSKTAGGRPPSYREHVAAKDRDTSVSTANTAVLDASIADGIDGNFGLDGEVTRTFLVGVVKGLMKYREWAAGRAQRAIELGFLPTSASMSVEELGAWGILGLTLQRSSGRIAKKCLGRLHMAIDDAKRFESNKPAYAAAKSKLDAIVAALAPAARGAPLTPSVDCAASTKKTNSTNATVTATQEVEGSVTTERSTASGASAAGVSSGTLLDSAGFPSSVLSSLHRSNADVNTSASMASPDATTTDDVDLAVANAEAAPAPAAGSKATAPAASSVEEANAAEEARGQEFVESVVQARFKRNPGVACHTYLTMLLPGLDDVSIAQLAGTMRQPSHRAIRSAFGITVDANGTLTNPSPAPTPLTEDKCATRPTPTTQQQQQQQQQHAAVAQTEAAVAEAALQLPVPLIVDPALHKRSTFRDRIRSAHSADRAKKDAESSPVVSAGTAPASTKHQAVVGASASAVTAVSDLSLESPGLSPIQTAGGTPNLPTAAVIGAAGNATAVALSAAVKAARGGGPPLYSELHDPCPPALRTDRFEARDDVHITAAIPQRTTMTVVGQGAGNIASTALSGDTDRLSQPLLLGSAGSSFTAADSTSAASSMTAAMQGTAGLSFGPLSAQALALLTAPAAQDTVRREINVLSTPAASPARDATDKDASSSPTGTDGRCATASAALDASSPIAVSGDLQAFTTYLRQVDEARTANSENAQTYARYLAAQRSAGTASTAGTILSAGLPPQPQLPVAPTGTDTSPLKAPPAASMMSAPMAASMFQVSQGAPAPFGTTPNVIAAAAAGLPTCGDRVLGGVMPQGGAAPAAPLNMGDAVTVPNVSMLGQDHAEQAVAILAASAAAQQQYQQHMLLLQQQLVALQAATQLQPQPQPQLAQPQVSVAGVTAPQSALLQTVPVAAPTAPSVAEATSVGTEPSAPVIVPAAGLEGLTAAQQQQYVSYLQQQQTAQRLQQWHDMKQAPVEPQTKKKSGRSAPAARPTSPTEVTAFINGLPQPKSATRAAGAVLAARRQDPAAHPLAPVGAEASTESSLQSVPA